jgi:hypothetical protein
MTFGARGRGLALAIVLAATFVGAGVTERTEVAAQGCGSRAVVVVQSPDHALNVTKSICFDGSVTGLRALELAGATPATYGFSGQGAAVCKLYGVGNDPSSCLIGPGGQYWAYYRAAPGASAWTYSRGGASSTTVVDGAVEGWRYGTGAAPGFVSFCSVVGCAPSPTEPPATAPPPAPPPAAPVEDPPSAIPGQPTAPSTTSSSAGNDTDVKGANDATTNTRKAASSDTESSGERSEAVEVAAAASSNDDGGGGSPAGLIVASAVVAGAVAGGLWLRRRRRGPAPG